ncbi:MAG: helix-turn-helix domain-containing protein [Spirochaetales bacterium]|nr:helix-turn-helix domain-containing protein [Spirochaetales bacterium]
MEKTLYNVNETSNYLGLKKSTIYAFSSRGKLPKTKFSGKLMFLKSDLDSFILNNRIEAIL